MGLPKTVRIRSANFLEQEPPIMQQNQVKSPFVDAEFLAEYFSVTAKHIRELARRGRIPCLRVGKVYRFVLADVIDALKRCA